MSTTDNTASTTNIATVEFINGKNFQTNEFIIRPNGPPSHLCQCIIDSFPEAFDRGEAELHFHTCRLHGRKGIILNNPSICNDPMIIIVSPMAANDFDHLAKLHASGAHIAIKPIKGHRLRFTFSL